MLSDRHGARKDVVGSCWEQEETGERNPGRTRGGWQKVASAMFNCRHTSLIAWSLAKSTCGSRSNGTLCAGLHFF
jgi:hypothetical protein